ncbi:MAG: (Fe-S)-binding protein, partial [Phycisphaerales bacterium]
MNPGNLVDNRDPSRITEHLRVRPDGAFVGVEPRATFFRFEAEEGLAHAASQCNGAGLCRRTAPGGTMCPSYRVLLDERHATRGRGNALRLAITGQLGGGGASWDDPATRETLSLCLSCKACKSECPSNVDLAKLKAEYTAQGFAVRGGIPWRTRVRGQVRRMQRLGSLLAPLANAAAALPPVRRALNALLGIAPWRPLPTFGPDLARRQATTGLPSDAPSVVLFGDCFTQFGEGSTGVDAAWVLERFGYRVVVADAGCCARSLISTGMLARAIVEVPVTARALRALVERERAVAVVVLEPSCLSAITDDWLDLSMPDEARMDARAIVPSPTPSRVSSSVDGWITRCGRP